MKKDELRFKDEYVEENMTYDCQKNSAYSDLDEEKLIMQQIHNIPVLSREETEDLLAKAKKGNTEAARELVEHNLRYVVKYVNEHYSANIDLGFSFMDLVNQGTLGLYNAIDRFDFSKGTSFLTCAKDSIHDSLSTYVAESSGVIRMSRKSRERVKAVRNAATEYRDNYGCEPTYDDIANEIGESVSSVRNTYFYADGPVSLDACVNNEDGEGCTLGDLQVDASAVNPEDAAVSSGFMADVNSALSCLTDRERGVVTLLWGIDGNKPAPVAVVAKKYNLSCEGIDFIQKKARAKVKGVMERLGYAA